MPRAPAVAPARDLAAAGPRTPGPAPAHAARDPRVVDLDIIRITARQTSPAGGVEVERVATADLFDRATAAAKTGHGDRALGMFRRLAVEFPASRYAPVSLYDIAAIYDRRGDVTSTIATLRELVRAYPHAREAIEGELYIAALQAQHARYADALATLGRALARTDLSYADRVEALAREGYCLVELHRDGQADAALAAAIAAWRAAPRIDDPYYIAMAYYYRGEIAHRRFLAAQVRPPGNRIVADLAAKRALAVKAYDWWKRALPFDQPYWATAAGYQMSQIFVDLWRATIEAPIPPEVAPDARSAYVAEIHSRVREHLEKALAGHRMNVRLARAFGVQTVWSEASARRAAQIAGMLARDRARP